jgi:hypothetical protein
MQQLMKDLHNLYLFASDIHGKGLFSTNPINELCLICVAFYIISESVYLESFHAKFVNHSTNPNCNLIRINNLVYLQSKTYIKKDVELTCDYSDFVKIFPNNRSDVFEFEKLKLK